MTRRDLFLFAAIFCAPLFNNGALDKKNNVGQLAKPRLAQSKRTLIDCKYLATIITRILSEKLNIEWKNKASQTLSSIIIIIIHIQFKYLNDSILTFEFWQMLKLYRNY